MVYFRVNTSLTNHKLSLLMLWKMHWHQFHYHNLLSLALSLLMVDFRVHTLLTDKQNYKLVLPSPKFVMKYVLPQAQLLPPKKPALLVLTDVRVSTLFTNQKLQIGSAKSKFCYKICIATGPLLPPKKLAPSLCYLWMLGCSPHLQIKISNWFC